MVLLVLGNIRRMCKLPRTKFTKLPVIHMLQNISDIEMVDDFIDEIISEESDFLMSPELRGRSWEFCLEPNEWGEICRTDVNCKLF